MNKLTRFLSMFILYGLGLFTGSQWGQYWGVPFFLTGIFATLFIIVYEIVRVHDE